MRVFRVGAVALIALSVASQGCLVPWSKYIKLKRQYDLLAREVERKDSQLAVDQERIASLSEELKSKDQLIKLYDDKKEAANRLTAQTRSELAKLQKKLEEFAKGYEGVDAIEGGIAIKDKLLFALGSADISPAGQKVLKDIAAEFKATDEIIQIDGHTDDNKVSKPETVKRFGCNWGLSSARAVAVLRLLAKSGIAEQRMYLRAFSMFKPRIPNATNEADRAKNRRVEVMFLPAQIVKAAAAPKKK